MSTRKNLSGYEKLLKKRKIEKQIESQKGSMDKFVTSIKKKKNTIESLGENLLLVLQMNKKLIKKSWKIMKLYNKKRIMKIVLIMFKHLM